MISFLTFTWVRPLGTKRRWSEVPMVRTFRTNGTLWKKKLYLWSEPQICTYGPNIFFCGAYGPKRLWSERFGLTVHFEKKICTYGPKWFFCPYGPKRLWSEHKVKWWDTSLLVGGSVCQSESVTLEFLWSSWLFGWLIKQPVSRSLLSFSKV